MPSQGKVCTVVVDKIILVLVLYGVLSPTKLYPSVRLSVSAPRVAARSPPEHSPAVADDHTRRSAVSPGTPVLPAYI